MALGAQPPQAQGMEGPEQGTRLLAQLFSKAFAHFARGARGEGHGQQALRRHAVHLDEIDKACAARVGLAGAGTGDHQYRPVGRQHRLALGRIEAFE